MIIEEKKLLELLHRGGYRHDSAIIDGLESGLFYLKEVDRLLIENLAEIYTVRLRIARNQPDLKVRTEGVQFCQAMIALAETSPPPDLNFAFIGAVVDRREKHVIVVCTTSYRVVASKKLRQPQ